MAIFDPAIFDTDIFDAGAAAAAAASTTGTGHWRGPARKGRKGGTQGRIRLLSELDPKRDEPLFTPDEILDPINVDGISELALDAMADMQRQIAIDLIERKRQLLLAQINDDEELFLVM